MEKLLLVWKAGGTEKRRSLNLTPPNSWMYPEYISRAATALTAVSEPSASELEANTFEIRRKISCLKPFWSTKNVLFRHCARN